MLPEDAAVQEDDDELDILVLVRKFNLKSCTWLKTRWRTVIVDMFHEDHH